MTPEQQSKTPETYEQARIATLEAQLKTTEQQRDVAVADTREANAKVEILRSMFPLPRADEIFKERDSLREQLKEAQREADNANEVADALTAYVPDSVRELKLQSENQLLTAQIVVMMEALKTVVEIDDEAVVELRRLEIDQQESWVTKKCRTALISTPTAAKELLERMCRMEKAIKICCEVFLPLMKIPEVQESLSTTQPPVNETESLYDSLRADDFNK